MVSCQVIRITHLLMSYPQLFFSVSISIIKLDTPPASYGRMASDEIDKEPSPVGAESLRDESPPRNEPLERIASGQK